MRLFVGIGLSPEATAAFGGIRHRLAPSANDLRWSAAEGWHITLQFLGNAEETRFSCLREEFGRIRAAPVPVRIAGLDFFERAGIFFAGVSLTPELLALQQKVVTATGGCGFVPESRPYHPHITLARVKGRSSPRALQPLKKALAQSPVSLEESFLATEFLLYESVPGPAGSTYQPRATFPLAGPRPVPG